MLPQIERVARAYTIPVYSGGGYASVTATWQAAQRAVERDVDTVLLQMGDLDRNGLEITTAFAEDVAAFAEADGDNAVEAERIALTWRQVEAHDLPGESFKPKKRDRAWVVEHGPSKWQAEALPPNVLATEVEAAIKRYIDADIYQARLDYEAEQNAIVLRWAADRAES